MEQTEKEKIAELQHTLFYESQYKSAILSNAISSYEANLTKDLIPEDITYRDSEGNIKSSMKILNMSAPCKFSEFISKWISQEIDPEYASHYEIFSSTRNFLIDSYNKGKRDHTIEYWFKNESGKEFFLSQRFLLTKNEDGDICVLAVLTNSTYAKKNEAQIHRDELEKYAYYDSLTEGYNYLKFKQLIKDVKTTGSIITLDIQSFKLINTSCGAATGDKVLKAIWNRINEVFDFDASSDSPVSSIHEFGAHINADRFIIFTTEEDREKIITKIKSVSYALNLISADLGVPHIKANFGISSWSPDKTIELAYSEAAAAKNSSKKLQDCPYAFFEKKDLDRLVWEENIIENFDTALAQNEFNIWYQPKFNPVTKKITGAEALVRWIKDGKFFVSPGEFIPLFENNGLIQNFDRYIFRNVCLQQKKWLSEGKNVVPVSINLSRVSLYYKNVIDIYSHIAEAVGVDKKLVPVEITETASITQDSFEERADAFIKAGFDLHMDDFGSGYSSLSALSSIPFKVWKLDKSLIDSIGEFKGERLIQHIIFLAKELGIHIVAEGVETREQNDFLSGCGCDNIQGYFYSKPLELSAFEKLL